MTLEYEVYIHTSPGLAADIPQIKPSVQRNLGRNEASVLLGLALIVQISSMAIIVFLMRLAAPSFLLLCFNIYVKLSILLAPASLVLVPWLTFVLSYVLSVLRILRPSHILACTSSLQLHIGSTLYMPLILRFTIPSRPTSMVRPGC